MIEGHKDWKADRDEECKRDQEAWMLSIMKIAQQIRDYWQETKFKGRWEFCRISKTHQSSYSVGSPNPNNGKQKRYSHLDTP